MTKHSALHKARVESTECLESDTLRHLFCWSWEKKEHAALIHPIFTSDSTFDSLRPTVYCTGAPCSTFFGKMSRCFVKPQDVQDRLQSSAHQERSLFFGSINIRITIHHCSQFSLIFQIQHVVFFENTQNKPFPILLSVPQGRSAMPRFDPRPADRVDENSWDSDD